MRLLVSRSVVAAVALTSSSALAQQTTPQDSAVKLPTVTVSAERGGSTSILTAPLAISKITAPELRSVSGVGLDEALHRVPGVLAQSRYGTSDVRITIRGFGARGAGDRSNAGTSRGIRVLVDGFPETEPDGRTSFDQIDLASAEAIEVIRSNASAVWGNAAGGVIHLLTVPSVTSPHFELQPVFGGFGLHRYATRLAAPVGSGTAYLNFTNTSFEGWRAHSDARRAMFNAGIVGTVGDRTKLGLYASAANNLFHIPGPLTQAQVDANPRQANATYATRDERRYNRIGRVGTTIDHEFDENTSLSAMLFVSPKYLQRSERGTFRDFTRYHVGGNVVGNKSMRLSPTVRSRLSVGVDEAYQDGAILFYSLVNGQRGPALMDNKGEGANNFGVFAQDELVFDDRLTLSLGARYDDVMYNYRSFINSSLDASKVFKRLTPKVGASWLFGGTHSVYANIGGGIEVPAGNETDPLPTGPAKALNPLLEPIISTTYEVGFKSLGGATCSAAPVTIGYDVALYDTEVKNEIAPYNGGRYYTTAGKARRSGLEIGLNALTSAGVFANGALTLSRNRYLTYVVDSSVFKAGGLTANFADHKIVGIPDMMANIELGTEVPGWRALRIKGSVEYVGKYFADDANRVNVPAYTLFDATAELQNPIASANGWSLKGFVTVRNIADRMYMGSAFLNPDYSGGLPVAFEPGMPRTLIVSLSVGRMR
jgi:iron complex outermembrane recepter protein